MTIDPHTFQNRARRAYELSRLSTATKSLYLLLPMVVIASLTCINLMATLLTGVILALTVIALKWRGQMFNHGANIGLLAGLVGFFVPMSFHAVGLCCRYDAEVFICIVSGAVMGGFIAWRASLQAPHSLAFFSSAAAAAVLMALMGCLSLGVGGIMGLLGGVFLVAAPYGVIRTLQRA